MRFEMKPITPFNVRRLRAGMLVCLLQASALTAAATDRAGPGALATVTARAMGGTDMAGFEGVVEAVRQTAIASQVSGAVLHPAVKAGDRVKAGQLLVRLDARAAEQSAAAGAAQANAARAELDVARSELARQRTLLGKQYISQAAFDRAEARFKAADAQVAAQLAEAGAARTQSGFYVLSAPYAGIIADVAIVQGDMAMPGRALMTLYDPLAMRITAPIPQSAVARLSGAAALGSVRVELPALAGANSSRTPTAITCCRWQTRPPTR